MKICGLQKLSLLDFPGYTAATVFTGGCNLRCPFCHNALLVTSGNFNEVISEKDFFDFLKNRTGLLDGVCVTGGEPLIQPDVEEFIEKIKACGFLVKLDTNGFFPERLQKLIDDNLLDYIAMDIKNSIEKYPQTTGIADLDTSPVLKSIDIIKSSGIDYEFRTTLVREFHTDNDIINIGKMINGAKSFSLQTFVDSGNLIGGNLSGFSLDETKHFADILSKNVQNIQIKGQ